jgi:hypothetical protein
MLNRIRSLTCSHERLRAKDYDESYHWVVTCSDCGHVGSMTQAEWRAWAKTRVPTAAPVTFVVGDDFAESGRVDISALLKR